MDGKQIVRKIFTKGDKEGDGNIGTLSGISLCILCETVGSGNGINWVGADSFQTTASSETYSSTAFFTNNVYIVVLLALVLVVIWAWGTLWFKDKNQGKRTIQSGLTGAQGAQEVLRRHGAEEIRCVSGALRTYFDSKDNTLYLKDAVYTATTVSAVGEGVYQAEKAVERVQAGQKGKRRLLRMVGIANKCALALVLIGLCLYDYSLFAIGVIVFALVVLFHVLHIFVEREAASRGGEDLALCGLLSQEELADVQTLLQVKTLTHLGGLLCIRKA